MNNKSKLGFGTALLLLLNFSDAQCFKDIEMLSWKTSDVIEAKGLISNSDVANFVNNKLTDHWYPINADQVGDYCWVDVNSDGVAEFFVTVSRSRSFFNILLIFNSSSNQKSLLQREHVWMLQNLDLAIKDLNKDGQYELLLPIELSLYRGADLMPVWTAVFRWHNGKFVRADARYRNFYKDILPSFDFEIEHAKKRWQKLDPASSDTKALEENRIAYVQTLAAYQIIRDKILRLIGKSRNAGYNEAIAWSNSQDPVMRENAVIVFEDINNEKSRKRLSALLKDPDLKVSARAKIAVESIHKPLEQLQK